ncbi:unnamed protein product [Kuraishia capsulata CBS 1993]|uniref:Uncharacterized protein n=1 Tax=Kuraishia capsulata CBS 1993 TaxID=1382522 RepID=W6MJJ3_9ASCO|nr:uncharacterized protein KUCA_T00002418001 [Kuraishia capsulata CBS 1993]CDK26446.1 unnamed protein product [Kuraishia capsulata CBS 1993]
MESSQNAIDGWMDDYRANSIGMSVEAVELGLISHSMRHISEKQMNRCDVKSDLDDISLQLARVYVDYSDEDKRDIDAEAEWDAYSSMEECSGDSACQTPRTLSSVPIGENAITKEDGNICLFRMHEVPKRLNPRCFQSHRVSPDQLGKVHVNPACPDSAGSHECTATARRNSMEYRYTRIEDDKVMCRFCYRQRWISKENLEMHLTMAHGIAFPEDGDSCDCLWLPLPTQLFQQNPRKLKRMHCKCPSCGGWIRLGFPESLPETNTTVDTISRPFEVMGLYTNYFEHIMKCLQ